MYNICNKSARNIRRKVEQRREMKERRLKLTTRHQKKQAQEQYTVHDKEEKIKDLQARQRGIKLAQEAESACSKGDIKTLYNVTVK